MSDDEGVAGMKKNKKGKREREREEEREKKENHVVRFKSHFYSVRDFSKK